MKRNFIGQLTSNFLNTWTLRQRVYPFLSEWFLSDTISNCNQPATIPLESAIFKMYVTKTKSVCFLLQRCNFIFIRTAMIPIQNIRVIICFFRNWHPQTGVAVSRFFTRRRYDFYSERHCWDTQAVKSVEICNCWKWPSLTGSRCF